MEKITVPSKFVELAKDWHSGQVTTLYQVASTGEVTIKKLIGLQDEVTECYLDTEDETDKVDLRRFKIWVKTQTIQYEEVLFEIWDESDEL